MKTAWDYALFFIYNFKIFIKWGGIKMRREGNIVIEYS